jgi:hypothetical protein
VFQAGAGASRTNVDCILPEVMKRVLKHRAGMVGRRASPHALRRSTACEQSTEGALDLPRESKLKAYAGALGEGHIAAGQAGRLPFITYLHVLSDNNRGRELASGIYAHATIPTIIPTRFLTTDHSAQLHPLGRVTMRIFTRCRVDVAGDA